MNQILTKVIPRVYEKLNYPNEKKIHLITFETNSKYYHWNKYDFLDTKINGDGGTNMNNVPNKLGEILKNMNLDYQNMTYNRVYRHRILTSNDQDIKSLTASYNFLYRPKTSMYFS